MTTMRYGKPTDAASLAVTGLELIENGYLSGADSESETLDLTGSLMYVLYTLEITASSGALRGYHATLITRTDAGAVSWGNLYESENTGRNITTGTGTMTLKSSSTSYDVYYSLYAVM